MKKFTVTLAIVALSFSNINATEVTITSNTIDPSFSELAKQTTSTLTRDQITEVYDWQVSTNQGNYSGTSLSIEEARKMIELVSTSEIVLSKKVESYYQVKDEISSKTQRLYFWEVTTNSGSAKGFSNSENQAKRMIQLVSSGAVLSYKIIQSADFEK